MYPIEIRAASSNGWFTPAESNAYYAARYAREGITVHWWGNGWGADRHDDLVNYMLAQAEQGIKSVNFVVSDAKITQLVDPDDVAWCSQGGNPTTVSIEFQPTLGAEGYKKGGWLINHLERRYGHQMSLYPHSHWFATSCPGSIDINRLRAEADKWNTGGYSDEMIADVNQAHLAYQLLRPNGDGSQGEIDGAAGKRTWAEFANSAKPEMASRNANLQNQAQQLQAAQAAVAELNSTVEQLKTQDAGDQQQLQASLGQISTLTQQLSDTHGQLADLQQKLAQPITPSLPQPSVIVGILRRIFHRI